MTSPEDKTCYCLGAKTDDSFQCRVCRQYYHLACLRSSVPPRLPYGDIFFNFTCSKCSPGEEIIQRQNLNWLTVLHLSLYNLIRIGNRHSHGFFRWRDEICEYVQQNWAILLPERKVTNAWHNTVAGVLSVNAPTVFRSGVKELTESGWWSLTDVKAPEFKLEIISTKVSSTKKRKHADGDGEHAKRSLRYSDADGDRSVAVTGPSSLAGSLPSTGFGSPSVDPLDERNSLDYPRLASERLQHLSTAGSSATSPVTHTTPLEAMLPRQPVAANLTPLFPYQERHLLHLLTTQYAWAAQNNTKARRLIAKLRLRQLKRDLGLPLLNIDEALLAAGKIAITPEEMTPSEMAVALSAHASQSTEPTAKALLRPLPHGNSSSGHDLLDRLRVVMPQSECFDSNITVPFEYRISGCPELLQRDGFVSPYTARYLKPFIRRDFETIPLRLKLLDELRSKTATSQRVLDFSQQKQVPIDYCYLRPHHLPAVNSLCAHFFWPGVDVTECLQYPDFSVVVLYKKLVVGCGFVTPDVKTNEAYISFFVVHPDWRKSGIGSFMLYHLIQACRGKDITLHVSPSNPAMMLLQKFGFKSEEFILDFYHRYQPSWNTDARHAFLMRLRW